MASGTSTSFSASTKKATKYHGSFSPSTAAEDITYLPPYDENKCTEVVQTSEFPKNSDLSGQSFINTVVDAYSFHHNLVIRPDDIWAAMMTQFSFYISKNAEDLRDKFANFGGKETVAVVLPGTLKDLKSDEFNKLMSDQVDANVTDAGLKEWIFPKFSTTTDSDTVTVGLTFMASMKAFFQPQSLACGIPNVTLEGSAQDWQDLLDKLEKLKEYKLEKWYDLLKPVIQQFVNAKQGTVDTVFWQRICHYEPNASATTYLSGWITVFCVFDKDGNWIESNWNGGGVKPESSSGADDGDQIDDADDDNLDQIDDADDDNLDQIDDADDDDGDQIDNAGGDDGDDDDDNDGFDADTKMDENLKDWLRIDLDKIPNGLFEVNVEMKDGSDAVFQTVMMAGNMGVEVKDDKVTIQPVLGWAVGLKPAASNKEKKDDNENVDQYGDNGSNEDEGKGVDVGKSDNNDEEDSFDYSNEDL